MRENLIKFSMRNYYINYVILHIIDKRNCRFVFSILNSITNFYGMHGNIYLLLSKINGFLIAVVPTDLFDWHESVVLLQLFYISCAYQISE